MKWGWVVLVFCSILAADQALKFAIAHNLTVGDPVTVIPGFFDLHLIYNPGAAFGLFTGFGDALRRVLLTGVSVIAIIVVGKLLWSSKGDVASQLGVAAILGGAFGNIIDRLRYDSVVDFLDFYLGQYHWPAFNIADASIFVGVCVLALRMLFPVKTPAKPSP
jgi:signal peptidase II